MEVLESYRPTPLPIDNVYPASRLLPPRVRVLIDALGEKGEKRTKMV